jgi:hypothetical protein
MTTSKANTKSKERKKRTPTATKVGLATEWTDYHGMLLLFGLRRTTTYHLVETEPALKGASISLKGEHEVRGKRLFNVPQFRRWLESKMVAQS